MFNDGILIDMIRSHNILWDSTQSIYRNKEFKDRIWEVIGEELDKSGEECKVSWVRLRAKYTREKCLMKQRGNNYETKWADFHKLSFLDDVMKPRRTHTNFKCTNKKSSQLTRFDDDDDGIIDDESFRESNVYLSNVDVLLERQCLKKNCVSLNCNDEKKMEKLKKLIKLQKLVCLINEVSKLKKLRRQPIIKQKMKRTVRRWWVRPTNWYRSFNNKLIRDMRELDPDEFFTFTRMSVSTFDELLELIKCRIEKQSIRKSISPDIRLYITLRHLATGDSYHSLHLLFRVGKSTVRKIILETCDVLWEVLSPIILSKPNQKEWEKISQEYEEKWNLPCCCGALDGKHIRCQAPPKSGSKFRNYKNFFSTVLLAVCDANYNFVYVDIGAYGSQSDGGVLENSSLGEMLEENEIEFPSAKHLPGTETPFNYYLIADTAFPLTHNIITPYVPARKPRRTVLTWGRMVSTRCRASSIRCRTVKTQDRIQSRTVPHRGRKVQNRYRTGVNRLQIGSNGSRICSNQARTAPARSQTAPNRSRTGPTRSRIGLLPSHVLYFNYRLRRARIPIENTFGILASRWRIYHRTIVAAPKNVDKLVKATVVLHNYIKSKKGDNVRYCPPGYADSESNGEIIDGLWRTETSDEVLLLVQNPIPSGKRNCRTAASKNRDLLLNYISPPSPTPRF